MRDAPAGGAWHALPDGTRQRRRRDVASGGRGGEPGYRRAGGGPRRHRGLRRRIAGGGAFRGAWRGRGRGARPPDHRRVVHGPGGPGRFQAGRAGVHSTRRRTPACAAGDGARLVERRRGRGARHRRGQPRRAVRGGGLQHVRPGPGRQDGRQGNAEPASGRPLRPRVRGRPTSCTSPARRPPCRGPCSPSSPRWPGSSATRAATPSTWANRPPRGSRSSRGRGEERGVRTPDPVRKGRARPLG